MLRKVQAPDGTRFDFECHEEMLPFQDMIFAGEYNLTGNFPVKTVVDCGANCGAFSIFAKFRWPECEVFAYEPAQINYPMLERNVRTFAKVHTERAAILMPESGKEKLYCGRDNQGQASFFLTEQCTDIYEIPPQRRPADLPDCDVLKVDTEGSERDIILGYLSTHQQKPSLIMFEYHGDKDRWVLDEALSREGYALCGGQIVCYERGTLKYLRKDLING